jgi:hypothetical protein
MFRQVQKSLQSFGNIWLAELGDQFPVSPPDEVRLRESDPGPHTLLQLFLSMVYREGSQGNKLVWIRRPKGGIPDGQLDRTVELSH